MLSQLWELKHRFRILVERGVRLYGIIDEMDTLVEGELYCRTDKKIIIGKVTITGPSIAFRRHTSRQLSIISNESPLNALHNCSVNKDSELSPFNCAVAKRQLMGAPVDQRFPRIA